MTIHLANLLGRLRLSQPFPVDGDKLISSVLPPVPDGCWGNDIRYTNLMHTMRFDPVTLFSLEVEHPEDEALFWVKFPGAAARGIEDDPLVVPKSNPFYIDLAIWVDAAYELHDRITGIKLALAGFIKAVRHPRNVEGIWPELYAFLKPIDTMGFSPVDVLPRRRLGFKLSPKQKADIIHALTEASMLPDRAVTAWVTHAVEE